MSAVNCTVQALLANAGVKAIVKQNVNPGIAPQNSTLPDLTVTRVSETPQQSLKRASGLIETRVQVECRAKTYTAVDKLGQAVRAALQDLRGTYAGRKAVFLAAGSDYDDHADDASVFRRMIDFYCWHNEPA